jgi:hypothetical protein
MKNDFPTPQAVALQRKCAQWVARAVAVARRREMKRREAAARGSLSMMPMEKRNGND